MQGRLWTPAVLRPISWFDASDLSTLTLGASGITAWRDKLGRSALTLNSTSNPALATVNAPAVNWTPLPVVTLNGTNQIFAGAAVSNYLSTTWSSIAAVRIISNPSGWTGLGDGAPAVWSDSGGYVGMVARTSGARFQAGAYIYNSGDRNIWADFTATASPEAGIIYIEFASTSSFTVAANLGAASASGNPAAGIGNIANLFRLGASYTPRYLGMELAELMTFGSALSDQARNDVGAYLAWKWGLQPRLMAGVPSNPFANRPPLIGD